MRMIAALLALILLLPASIADANMTTELWLRLYDSTVKSVRSGAISWAIGVREGIDLLSGVPQSICSASGNTLAAKTADLLRHGDSLYKAFPALAVLTAYQELCPERWTEVKKGIQTQCEK